MPASVLERPPSAELRQEQLDEDSLPPYAVLDAILAGYVEEDLDAAELVARGLPADDVERVIAMVDAAEHKRRQQPPGIKISTKGLRARPAAADHQPLSRQHGGARGRASPGRSGSGSANGLPDARAGRDRPSRGVAAFAALPLAGFALLMAAPDADVRWGASPLPLLARARGLDHERRAGVFDVGGRCRRGDARLYLVSLAFLAAAGFLGLHALATPGVLLDGPNQGFTIATPVAC